jgi:large subunit ribosomal protein L13
MYTRSTPTAEAIANRNWWVIDLEGERLGRAATRIAHILRGKHKPTYTPHANDGDYVIVINASKAVFTGNKMQDKKYYRHTGYVGGLKEINADDFRKKDPEAWIKRTVKGMLPRGPLGRAQLRNMKVYEGNDHPHAAQLPKVLELTSIIGKAQ